MRSNRGIGRRAAVAVAALVVAVAAGSALAGDMGGHGPLEDVIPDDRTVKVRGVLYDLTRFTEMYDAKGKTIGLHELEDAVGGFVLYAGQSRRPRPVLERIQIAPDDD